MDKHRGSIPGWMSQGSQRESQPLALVDALLWLGLVLAFVSGVAAMLTWLYTSRRYRHDYSPLAPTGSAALAAWEEEMGHPTVDGKGGAA